MVAAGDLVKEGSGPAVGYRLAHPLTLRAHVTERLDAKDSARASVSPAWSPEASDLRAQLEAPLGTRLPVTYQRSFVDDYQPNQTFLLPAGMADSLFAQGRAQGQQPAGTYARKVLEQLLIDLSWHSSRLEGNRKSFLDTRELFAKGRSSSDDLDATMLLNHKDAIEFIVDAVPEYGIAAPVVRNVQSLLMQGLLANPASLGAIRTTVVNISDTVYVPTQVPSLLEEMFDKVILKARSTKNPVEAAFFLWVNLAYLQPFEDGNKRTSRLSANLPLMLANCAPLSFIDVEPHDYAMGMLGVYERLDVKLAVELFEWTYQRSIRKYKVVVESMEAPNQFRAKCRELLGDAIRQIVSSRTPVKEAVAQLSVPEADAESFEALLLEELLHLQPYNCARYRLTIAKTQEWIDNGTGAG